MDDDFHANLDALVTKRKAFLLARQREPIDDLFQQNEEMFVFLYNLINDSVFELKFLMRKSATNGALPQTEPTYSQFHSAPTSPAVTPRKVLVPETPPAKVVQARAKASTEKALQPTQLNDSVSPLPTKQTVNTPNEPKQKPANEKTNAMAVNEVSKPPVQPKRKSLKKKLKGKEKKFDTERVPVDVDYVEWSSPDNEPVNESDDGLNSSQSSGDMMTQPPVAMDTKRKSEISREKRSAQPQKVTSSNAPTIPPRNRQETVPSNAPTVPPIPTVTKLEPLLERPEPQRMDIERNNEVTSTSSVKKSRDNQPVPDFSTPVRKVITKAVGLPSPTSNVEKLDGSRKQAPTSTINATQSPRRTAAEPPRTPQGGLRKKASSDYSTSTRSGSKNGSSSRNTFGSASSSGLRKRRKRKRPRVSLEELEPEPILETCRDDIEDDDVDFVQDPRSRKTPLRPVSTNSNKSPRKTVQSALKFKTGPSPTGLRFEGFRTPAAVDRAIRKQAAEKRRIDEGIAAKETVLGHARKALQGYDCHECAEMFEYEAAGDPVRKQQLLKHCKHKAKKPPPQTPDDYWKLTFDETQTQAPATLRQEAEKP